VKIAVFLIAAAAAGQAASIPMTLISEGEAEPIHSAIIRKEAWTLDSVRRLRAEADKRLREGPWTVTSDRPAGMMDVDPHDYYSEAPFWWPDPDNPAAHYIRKEGQPNPARFMANKIALHAMSDAVFTLGTAAFLLDDTRYANRAERVIHTWFVSPKTRMNPNLEYAQSIPGLADGRGVGILEGRVLIRAIQGMEFLAQTGAWDVKEQAAVRRWFEEYLRWLTESENGQDEKRSGNNHASWWAAQTAAVATFVDNKPVQKMVFDYYRDRLLPRQVRPDGTSPREESTSRPLAYSAYNLEAFATICRIAQVQGVDLWSVKTRSGAGIANVIDYLQGYLADPRRWAKEQVSDTPADGPYFLAFAGIGLKKPEYVSLFRKLERPEGAWISLVDLVVSRWEAAAHQTRH
jgi:hypothetical protein